MTSNSDHKARQLAANCYWLTLAALVLVAVFFAVLTLSTQRTISPFFWFGGILVSTAFTCSFLELIIALLCWSQARNSHSLVQATGKQLVNFQLSMSIYSAISIFLFYYLAIAAGKYDYVGAFLIWGLFICLSPFVLTFKVGTLLRGAHLARSGQVYKPALTIPIFR